MLERAETARPLTRRAYEALVPELRVGLVNAQDELRRASFPVVLVLDGDDRPGCLDVLAAMRQWMDTRYLDIHVCGRPRKSETRRPWFWRFWRRLPGEGEFAVFHEAWPVQAVADAALDAIDGAAFERRLDHIRAFEGTLAAEGALIVKIWIHQPLEVLRARREEGGAARATRRWRLPERERRLMKRLERALECAERLLARTSTGALPWHVVDGRHERTRDVVVARTILSALTRRLERPGPSAPAAADAGEARSVADGPASAAPATNVLETVDLSASVPDEKAYERRLGALQDRVGRLTRRAHEARVATVVVLEGWDAAGKGGSIRRLVHTIDAHDVRVVPVAAPTPTERAHHYLWRFWTRLPRDGEVVVFDRSWYGRVLVERVERLCPEEAWRRAYGEIRDLEEQLVEHGVVLVKLWLHVSAQEQWRRFQARAHTPYKRYKLTEEDHRNRERRQDYVRAVDEMVRRTETRRAPWTLVAAEDKRHARLRVIETVCDALARRLGGDRAAGGAG